MGLRAYGSVLRVRGVAALLLIGFLARIPITATSIALTLHVVDEQGEGYAAAGLVGAAMTVGSAIGAPWLGRWADRVGMRPVIVLTGVAGSAFWLLSPRLPFGWLLAAAGLGGLLTLPAFSIVRQALTALVPEDQRRQAFSLDAMTVELSYMAGPAGAVLLASTVSATASMIAIGAGLALSAALLTVLNPPVRAAHEKPADAAPAVPRRVWLRPPMLMAYAIAAASTLVLAGTDVATVAVLRDGGEVGWTGLVLGVWAAASLAGGFVYGTLPRPLGAVGLLAGLSLLTIPVGLAGDLWWLLALALIPAGALCAPTLTATTEQVSALAPASARGEALGLHGSALTVGMAIGAPLTGAVIDAFGGAWGFAAAGAAGLLIALAALPVVRRARTRALPPDESTELAPDPVPSKA
ncbi:MFS transporter [Catenuloplanes atrovinosus]|uniref:MFS family permease n=1 Tax=Catenuloplanes atrovinosus TaxID=137266 RepID=A0AAE3YSD5_9ACTN|nr:MFS transporter [Catenuloplanes atrovinosus]MDR7279019.1 MFS family permease [Catenuloplanes atrovinosus]